MMKEKRNIYHRRFIAGMLGYIILLPASLLLLNSERPDNVAVAVVVALIPVLPFLYAMFAVVGNVRRQDEMQRRIHLEAVLITALLTGAATFSYGLLEAAELAPDLSMVFVAPFMIVVWGIANVLISRRYG
jgi:hypothetical protein